MSETILIASNSCDVGAWRPVAEALEDSGYEALVYESDKVADGSIPLQIHIGATAGELSIEYADKPLCLTDVGAAWYRRPNYYTGEISDKGFQLSIATEYQSIQQALWDMVPATAWLNRPQTIRHAETKLTQLTVAAEVGFAFPDTLATNRWSGIQDELPGQIIFKPAKGMLYQENKLKMTYVKALDNDAGTLPLQSNPYPGLWQARIGKAREWRITAVGDEFFDAAIYTDDSAKDDWRRHQTTQAVTFAHATFPDVEKEKCRAYMQKMNLRYGAFDFIESSDGTITFLECNPNGQYGWLESQLGLPISRALANELIAIAKRR